MNKTKNKYVYLIHKEGIVNKCYTINENITKFEKKTVVKAFVEIAEDFPEHWLIWSHLSNENNLNHELFDEIFHHKRIMASYSQTQYLPNEIGFIDRSPFINVNYTVKYSTWRMHEDIGGIYTNLGKEISQYLDDNKEFNYFLHSLAKLAQKNGVLVYSEPRLFDKETSFKNKLKKTDYSMLFEFVAKNYKWIWKHILLLNILIYKNKFPILAWFKSLFNKQINVKINLKSKMPVEINRNIHSSESLDVIIPTIGRKKYIYDFLIDLSKQNYLPKRIIIIEQNPDKGSKTELDFLYAEKWPFDVTHRLIYKTGACNARNIGIDLVKSKWVFFADDDIRIDESFIGKALDIIRSMKIDVLVTECLQQNQKSLKKDILAWHSFGSGTSIVNSKSIKDIRFNNSLELGYGEDKEFGMQLRNLGYDIIYTSICSMVHLKAPVGGFRAKPKIPWADERPFPKPSPTVLLSRKLHHSKQQFLGYKTLLFFNTLKYRGFHKIILHYIYFKKAWRNSVYWAQQLQKNND